MDATLRCVASIASLISCEGGVGARTATSGLLQFSEQLGESRRSVAGALVASKRAAALTM